MISSQGRRPREYYGPRALLPDCYGNNPKARRYDKKVTAARGDEAMPAETGVLEPNLVAKRRSYAGYEDTMQLARAMATISYQRLKRIENGRVIVRESEYELLADFLHVDIDDLKLPLLTRSETAEWNRMWGPRRRVEEGGDHDSVILSAYVRHLVELTGRNRTQIVRRMGAPGNSLCAIWFAEKPIDRYPDSTMTVVIKIANVETWDDVVLLSRSAYGRGELRGQIDEIHQPRLRFAPEDPDRKAPWTFETDPFRARKGRKAVRTPFSADPPDMKKSDRQKLDRQQARAEKTAEMDRRCRAAFDEARTCDVAETLFRLFPADPRGREEIERNVDLARNVIARTILTRGCRDWITFDRAAEAIGRTRERVRQMLNEDDGRVRTFVGRMDSKERPN